MRVVRALHCEGARCDEIVFIANGRGGASLAEMLRGFSVALGLLLAMDFAVLVRNRTMSTRRLAARPSAVLLPAMG